MSAPVIPVAAVQSVTRELRAASAVTQSPFTFAQQAIDWGGRMWVYEFDMQTRRGDNGGRALAAFLAGLGGVAGRFLWTEQSAEQADYAALGAPVVDGGDQTGGALATRGWVPGETVLRAGDLLSLGAGAATRLYQVVADAQSDGSGDAVIAIVPDLRVSPVDGAALNVTAPQVVLRLTRPAPASIAPADIYRFSLQAQEAL